MIRKLYKFFEEKDATLIEINPLGLTVDNHLLICDSKISIDENSKYR
jgi:succinyl-CoA synthetase beta subunit